MASDYRSFLPYLAVAETIATRGKSPGTMALKGEQIYLDAEERKKQAEDRLEQAKVRALQQRVAESGLQVSEGTLSEQKRKRDALQRALGNPNLSLTEEDKMVLENNPDIYFSNLYKKKDLSEKSKEQSAKDTKENSKINFEEESKLRDQFDKNSKTFNEVRNSFLRVEASGKNPTAAGDLSLIFNYMKILDPQSVVRESEFATAENSASVPERIRRLYNKVVEGERLGINQRADFLNRSRLLFKEQAETQQNEIDRFTGIAQRRELNPENVVVNFSPKTIKLLSEIEKTLKEENPVPIEVITQNGVEVSVRLSDGSIISMNEAKSRGYE